MHSTQSDFFKHFQTQNWSFISLISRDADLLVIIQMFARLSLAIIKISMIDRRSLTGIYDFLIESKSIQAHVEFKF